jgi:hypothetical protein
MMKHMAWSLAIVGVLTSSSSWLQADEPDKKAARAKEDEALKKDLEKMQGKWEGRRTGPDGKEYRLLKEIKGNKETVSYLGDKDQVEISWSVDFKLERSGKARVFRYSNMKLLEGPNRGQEVKGESSYIYRVTDDYFFEVVGFLEGQEKMPIPTMNGYKRIKE